MDFQWRLLFTILENDFSLILQSYWTCKIKVNYLILTLEIFCVTWMSNNWLSQRSLEYKAESWDINILVTKINKIFIESNNNQAVGVSCSLYCWLRSCHKICPSLSYFNIYIIDGLICSIMFTSQSLYWRQITTMPRFFFQLKQMIHQLLSQDFPTFIIREKVLNIWFGDDDWDILVSKSADWLCV